MWWLLLHQQSDSRWGEEPVVFLPISASPTHTTPGLWVTELNVCDHFGSTLYADTPTSTLYLLLISLPPLHFSKLRCNFVSLQWFHASTLPVAFPPVSCSCRDSGLVVLHWMTNQGHICSTLRYLYLNRFAPCWCYSRSLLRCKREEQSQHTSLLLVCQLPLWMMLKQTDTMYCRDLSWHKR